MGNNLRVRFVLKNGHAVTKLEDSRLGKLLDAVFGDVYSKSEVNRIYQSILSLTAFDGNRGGIKEFEIPGKYWIKVWAYEGKEIQLGLGVDEAVYYRFDSGAERVMSDFVKRAKKAFDALKPWYGYAETDESIDAMREAYDADVKPHAHLCWLNYYSPELAGKIGRDKILSAARETAQELGGVTIDELVNGAIVLQMGKMPGHVDNLRGIKVMEKALFGKTCKYDAKRV